METTSHKSASLDTLRQNLTSLTERFKSAAERFKPISAVLVNESTPGNTPEPDWPDLQVAQGKHFLGGGGGPFSECQQLSDRASYESVKDRPFRDIEGNPIVNSAGEPIPLRPGWMRQYRLYGSQFPGSSPFDFQDALAEWKDAATDATRTLRELPARARAIVWREWVGGFLLPSDGPDLWLNAVFELAWQNHPGSGLAALRKAWRENYELKIEDLPTAKEKVGKRVKGFGDLIAHVGDPPAYWYSEIPNVWRASEKAAILLARLLREPPEAIAAKLSPAGVVGIRALALHLQAHNHPGIHALRFQDGIRAEGGDALAAIQELERLGVVAGRYDSHQCATVFDFDAEYVGEILAEVGNPPVDPPENEPPQAKHVDSPRPYEVNESLCQIRVDGKAESATAEAARMAKLLLDNSGEWVSMSENGFTKPSEVKKKLPEAIQAMVETEKGKGYRLKPRR